VKGKAEIAKAEKLKSEGQFVSLSKCDCGKGNGAYLNHYDIVRCNCGAMWWALRPLRNGPLIAFPWPGQYQRERMAA
jgi:hypothetical protein